METQYMADGWGQQCYLPSIVCSKILSFLNWKDKIVTALALPGWHRELHSTQVWQWVEFLDLRYGDPFNESPVEVIKEQMKCIRKYGKYFQHCSVIYDAQPNSCGTQLVVQISMHCTSLKYLRIYHDFVYCSNHRNDVIPPGFLKQICVDCHQLRGIQLCGLENCEPDQRTNKVKLLQMLQDIDICSKIDLLDMCLSYRCQRPVQDLVLFKNLRTLKTDLINLTQESVQTLVNCRLRNLHVLKNRYPETFWDSPKIDWTKIQSCRKKLKVHYSLEEIRISKSDFTPNPYLHSITLSRISRAVSRDVIRHIADLYGNSLQKFVHFSMLYPTLSPYEDMDSLPCDYYFFASQCVHLRTFIAGVPMQCEAVWCLAMKAKELQNLVIQRNQLIYRYRVCLPLKTFPTEGSLDCEENFCKEISYWMQHHWFPLDEDAMCEKVEMLMQL